MAPVYKKYELALRLKNTEKTELFITDANIPNWFPGDIIYDDQIFIPYNMPEGEYELQLGIVSPVTHQPEIKIAIKGMKEEGWYPMGKISIMK